MTEFLAGPSCRSIHVSKAFFLSLFSVLPFCDVGRSKALYQGSAFCVKRLRVRSLLDLVLYLYYHIIFFSCIYKLEQGNLHTEYFEYFESNISYRDFTFRGNLLYILYYLYIIYYQIQANRTKSMKTGLFSLFVSNSSKMNKIHENRSFFSFYIKFKHIE